MIYIMNIKPMLQLVINVKSAENPNNGNCHKHIYKTWGLCPDGKLGVSVLMESLGSQKKSGGLE